ncbi:unnamed protein product [Caenorhabditis auriculariae]|uniref:DFDF domain-containing protein n=1 Tax=Caenorhabditis auriculariae TaxID=2777116 RepID=A0A8S1HX39_9PELO|nr:unnamed protein product [Caenorhabditis auriculariae]
MGDNYIGSVISVECVGGGGVYQGKLTAVDPKSGNITLANVFKEGIPLGKCVTLNSNDISSLKVLKSPATAKLADQPSSSKQCTIMPCSNGSPVQKTSNSRKNTKEIRNTRDKFIGNGKENDAGRAILDQFRISPQKEVKTKNKLAPIRMPTEDEIIPVDIAPTPQFRNFEPQIPRPTALDEVSQGAKKPSKKGQGPSGIPLLDALNAYKGYGRRNGRNNGDTLHAPIDFDLEADFDFAANLELFRKEEDDDEFFEKVEKLKMSQNFAHYENIVEDEGRVTSWTNILAKRAELGNGHVEEQHSVSSNTHTEEDDTELTMINGRATSTSKIRFESSSFEKSSTGLPVPAISAIDKKSLIEECVKRMGQEALDTAVTDRFFCWASDVAGRYREKDDVVVVIASSTTSLRSLRRLLTHFDNRGVASCVYGKYPGEAFRNVRVVERIDELPKNKLVCLLSSKVCQDVSFWLKQQNSAHFVCIETIPEGVDPRRVHLLMLCVATAGVRHVSHEEEPKAGMRRMTFEELCKPTTQKRSSPIVVDCAVADIGAPFSWLDDSSHSFLTAAFRASDFLIRLSSN